MRQTTLAIIFILLLAAIGVIWFLFLRRPSAEVPAASPVEESETLRRLRALKQIRLDTGLFADPRFQALKRPAALPPPAAPAVSPGRPNPFAPF